MSRVLGADLPPPQSHPQQREDGEPGQGLHCLLSSLAAFALRSLGLSELRAGLQAILAPWPRLGSTSSVLLASGPSFSSSLVTHLFTATAFACTCSSMSLSRHSSDPGHSCFSATLELFRRPNVFKTILGHVSVSFTQTKERMFRIPDRVFDKCFIHILRKEKKSLLFQYMSSILKKFLLFQDEM